LARDGKRSQEETMNTDNLNFAFMQLRHGHYGRAWETYERDWGPEHHQQTMLRHGDNVNDKTVYLYNRNGFGDGFQFVRYVTLLKQKGARVVMECKPEQYDLLKTVDGLDLALRDGDPVPAFRYHSALFDLPYVFRTEIDGIYAPRKYLHVKPEKQVIWHEKLGKKRTALRVGLMWQGSIKGQPGRSIPFDLIYNYLIKRLPDVEFVSLQKNCEDISTVRAITWSQDLSFQDAAAICENCDLVVSVDTSMLHLAAALGRPVWALIPFIPDWRWHLWRTDSPWYPTIRLYRQKFKDEWEDAVDKVKTDMEKLL
jgi:Glycosyltransferase family 9 (heptosyltransferase)